MAAKNYEVSLFTCPFRGCGDVYASPGQRQGEMQPALYNGITMQWYLPQIMRNLSILCSRVGHDVKTLVQNTVVVHPSSEK